VVVGEQRPIGSTVSPSLWPSRSGACTHKAPRFGMSRSCKDLHSDLMPSGDLPEASHTPTLPSVGSALCAPLVAAGAMAAWTSSPRLIEHALELHRLSRIRLYSLECC
jgi:hypothetical protein